MPGKLTSQQTLVQGDLACPVFAMVKAVEGVLVNCDPAIKEILLFLDNTMHFIIEDLDPTHLFIDKVQLKRVQEELDKRLAENVYKPSD